MFLFFQSNFQWHVVVEKQFEKYHCSNHINVVFWYVILAFNLIARGLSFIVEIAWSPVQVLVYFHDNICFLVFVLLGMDFSHYLSQQKSLEKRARKLFFKTEPKLSPIYMHFFFFSSLNPRGLHHHHLLLPTWNALSPSVFLINGNSYHTPKETIVDLHHHWAMRDTAPPRSYCRSPPTLVEAPTSRKEASWHQNVAKKLIGVSLLYHLFSVLLWLW